MTFSGVVRIDEILVRIESVTSILANNLEGVSNPSTGTGRPEILDHANKRSLDHSAGTHERVAGLADDVLEPDTIRANRLVGGDLNRGARRRDADLAK